MQDEPVSDFQGIWDATLFNRTSLQLQSAALNRQMHTRVARRFRNAHRHWTSLNLAASMACTSSVVLPKLRNGACSVSPGATAASIVRSNSAVCVAPAFGTASASKLDQAVLLLT